MNVSFIADAGNADGSLGGAELTMREFADAAPEHVTLTDDLDDADAVVVGNCVTFGPDLIDKLKNKPVVRYVHDAWPWGDTQVREWMLDNATCVFTSPLHRKTFKWNCERWEIIPPAVDTERFKRAAKGDRPGLAVHVGHFYWAGKGPQALVEWSEREQTQLNVYGDGPHAPHGRFIAYRGPLGYDDIPETLGSYEKFVHLPTGVEPFGRGVVEAHAAGCKVVTNGNVGATYFLQEAPEKLESAAGDFWRLVEQCASG